MTTSLPRLFGAALALALSLPVHAATPPDSALLEELRNLTQQSRERRAADRWLQRALDDLIAKYDYPWQRTLLFEDFADGDFNHNPTWQVTEGRFEVIRGQGLSSRLTPNSPANQGTHAGSNNPQVSPEAAVAGLIAGALFGNKGQQPAAPEPAPAPSPVLSGPHQIQLKAKVTNAFALTLAFRLDSTQEGAFELALLQSERGSYGYRLLVDSHRRGGVELQRIRGGRGAIVESQPLPLAINDGRLHDLIWRQDRDGTVSVLLDDKRVFEVRDRAFRDPYPWLQLRHTAGDLSVRSVRIDGT